MRLSAALSGRTGPNQREVAGLHENSQNGRDGRGTRSSISSGPTNHRTRGYLLVHRGSHRLCRPRDRPPAACRMPADENRHTGSAQIRVPQGHRHMARNRLHRFFRVTGRFGSVRRSTSPRRLVATTSSTKSSTPRQAADRESTPSSCRGLMESEAYLVQARYLHKHNLAEAARSHELLSILLSVCPQPYGR